MRTIEAWVNLFDEANRQNLPILKMELIFDDHKMQFYPAYEDLEELVLFVMEEITNTLQQVDHFDLLFRPTLLTYFTADVHYVFARQYRY